MCTLNRKLLLGLTALVLLSLAGCADDDPASPTGDTTAPAAVTDLHIVTVVGGVVTLAWTAPGDDGDTGTASEYDIRYTNSSVTESNWEACTRASTEPEPTSPGIEQSAVISTSGDTDLYFALKTSDEASNWSSLSNVVTARMGGGFVVHQLTSDGLNTHPCVDDGVVVWVHFTVDDGDEIYIANLETVAPTPKRLTDNGGEKEHPNNHGSERIVWEGRSSALFDWEIWLYNKYTTPRFSQFTDNEVTDRYADLSRAGSFFWLQGNTMYEEVHYWHESGHTESVISNDCCPTTGWSNAIPSADDGAVVWRAYDRIGSEGHKAYLWDGTLTNITDIIEAGMAHNYSLYAGTIAYEYGASRAMIKYWNGSTIQDVGEGFEPSLYDGTVAYEVWDGDWEIRYWDGSTVHDITDNDYNDTQCSLSGTIIAWVGRTSPSADHIFYVDVTE